MWTSNGCRLGSRCWLRRSCRLSSRCGLRINCGVSSLVLFLDLGWALGFFRVEG